MCLFVEAGRDADELVVTPESQYMQTSIAAIIILIASISSEVHATGQEGERIIFEGDTLQMMCEPLESYLSQHEPRKKLHIRLDVGCSTALWRGYVGLWEYKNNKLFLVDIYDCGNMSKSILNSIFKDQDNETPILASWFTGQLFIQKGKLIKYQHTGYERIYEEEIVVDIEKGESTQLRTYDNGVKPNDKGFSRDPNEILNKIYEDINWAAIPKLSKDYELSLTFQVGDNGEFINKKIDGDLDEIYKNEIDKVVESFPSIQVLYSRGKPAHEGWVMRIVFSRSNKRKYTR